jgi:hypothetical protein
MIIKRCLAIIFIFAVFVTSLMAVSANDYRTDTPDPLIRNIPTSIRNLRTQNVGLFLERLAEFIDENAVNEFDKVKKAHDWVALNIRYHASAFFSGRFPSQSVTQVVSSGLAVCAGYAEVFKYLCDLLKIESVIITGYARGIGSTTFGTENPYNSNHAWNRVKIYDNWYLVDSTWNSGFINNQRTFTARYKTEYLFTDPHIFIHTHFPGNPQNQLLPIPLTSQEFTNLPRTSANFFARVANLVPVSQRITPVNGRFFRLDFTSPINHHFLFSLFSGSGSGRVNNVLNYSNNSGKHTITFSFHRSGDYRLMFYSSPTGVGTHNGIGEFGFRVQIPEVIWGEIPADAVLLSPETQNLIRNTQTEFKVKPGKWNYITLIQGTNWHYLTLDENGVYSIIFTPSLTGQVYLAASETEYGVYETLAVFNVR